MKRNLGALTLACLLACGAYAYPVIDLPGAQDGADRLLRRIRDGAMTRCDLMGTPRVETAAMHERQCMRVVAQVNSAIVTARYDRVGASLITASMSVR